MIAWILVLIACLPLSWIGQTVAQMHDYVRRHSQLDARLAASGDRMARELTKIAEGNRRLRLLHASCNLLSVITGWGAASLAPASTLVVAGQTTSQFRIDVSLVEWSSEAQPRFARFQRELPDLCGVAGPLRLLLAPAIRGTDFGIELEKSLGAENYLWRYASRGVSSW